MSGDTEAQVLCIYHGNCPDGFTAAWIVSRFHGHPNVELYPASYQTPPPLDLIRDRVVYIVDFSYKREPMKEIFAAAHSCTVLDHHKTAQEELAGLMEETGADPARFHIEFDMSRSGAGITWDYFFPGEDRPWVVDYVEDRDLWKFKLENSKMISLFIRTTPYDLKFWDNFLEFEPSDFAMKCAGVQQYLDHYADNVAQFAYPFIISWQENGCTVTTRVVAVNCAYTGISDVLHKLLQDNLSINVALGWFVGPTGEINVSLRSREYFDCSRIAKSFGGGGHAQAAGFKVPLDQIQNFIRSE